MPETSSTDRKKSEKFTAVWLSIIGSILIAVVLQFAAAAKVSSGADSLQLLDEARIAVQAGLEPDVSSADMRWFIPPGGGFESGILLDFALATVEFGVVLLLLLLHRGRLMWMVIALMFSGFFGYALLRALNDDPCGCFGTLWQPPTWVSLTIDLVAVGLAFILLAIRRTPKPILGGVLVLAIASGIAGYLYARATDPLVMPESTPPHGDAVITTPEDPPPGGDSARETTDASLTAAERLLNSSVLADIRDLTLAEPGLAVYVFVWSPECSTCQAMRPSVDALAEQYEAEANPVLRVHSVRKKTIASTTDIEEHDWESSPVILVVQDAAIVATYAGESSPLPNQVFEALMTGQPLEDLAL